MAGVLVYQHSTHFTMTTSPSREKANKQITIILVCVECHPLKAVFHLLHSACMTFQWTGKREKNVINRVKKYTKYCHISGVCALHSVALVCQHGW